MNSSIIDRSDEKGCARNCCRFVAAAKSQQLFFKVGKSANLVIFVWLELATVLPSDIPVYAWLFTWQSGCWEWGWINLFVASRWVPLFIVINTSAYWKSAVVVKSIGKLDIKGRVKWGGEKATQWEYELYRYVRKIVRDSGEAIVVVLKYKLVIKLPRV